MAKNRLRNLPREDLLELLVVVTRQFNSAIDAKASRATIQETQKKLELVREALGSKAEPGKREGSR